MLGRPRAMDGSADLKWRYMQSRAGGRGGLGGPRTGPQGRMLNGFGRNANIPYNWAVTAAKVAVPRYHYDGGPQVNRQLKKFDTYFCVYFS